MTLPDTRLPAAIDAAMLLIQATVQAVAGRVSDALGASAQSTARISERDLLNTSQFELRRHMGTFQLIFKESLRDKIDLDLAPRDDNRRKLAQADWQTLSLVDDHEVEERMFADRIGQMIAHDCEAELRELAAYMGALMGTGRADLDRNPLRADSLGGALYKAIEAVSEQGETRKLLARDLGHALARAMPACYAQIVADLRKRGVEPVVLTVRGGEGPGYQLPGLNSAYASLDGPRGGGGNSQSGDYDAEPGGTGGFEPTSTHGRRGPRGSMAETMPSTLGSSQGTGYGTSHGTGYGTGQGTGYGTSHGSTHRYGPGAPTRPTRAGGVPGDARPGAGGPGGGGPGNRAADLQLMALLRRLTAIASGPGELDALEPAGRASGRGAMPGHHAGPDSIRGDVRGYAPTRHADAGHASGGGDMMAVNLIRAHRDELMQASPGQLDHMVIDVVGSLFDQILSDARVPPQMARQIARLQLPVLRVALNDASFFTSRRHPVRRFVNRIASLACAFDDFDDGPGKPFLERVRQLVQEIVDGDFDQIDLYTAKLAQIEGFIGEQTEAEVKKTGTAGTLHNKESELRMQQGYMRQLQEALRSMSLPAYLREFVSQVWSQALVLAVRRDGPVSDRAQRYRRVGRDLIMSVQPKGSPVLRKKFLMQLPPLMKDLNEGMQAIGWPAEAQRAFFGQLLPAHAESLKGQPMSELDYNMMAKQLEAIFAVPVPGADSPVAGEPLAAVDEAQIEQRFSPEEARRVGLVQESAVDWSGAVDIDLSEQAANDAEADEAANPDLTLGLDIDLGRVEPAEPPEPTRGPRLVDHIKLGFAYQMHLNDQWQKVRLTHVSAGRGFFVFTRGKKHQETISMTSRMLARMCETGRMRAVESAYLMERATHRARKQLAALRPGAATRH